MLQEDVGVYVVDEVIEHIRLGMEVSTKNLLFVFPKERTKKQHSQFLHFIF